LEAQLFLKKSEMKMNRTISVLALAMVMFFATTAFTLTPAQRAYGSVTPPPMPEKIEVPEGHTAFLVGHAVGTQNYVCRPSGSGVAFVLFTPQASLFGEDDRQLITHFFSPNPAEANTDPKVIAARTIRAAWQDSRDTSTVWAKADPEHTATAASDPAFVAQGAVAWLRLEVVGSQEGPEGGDRLTKTKFIQRLNTSGGLAPSTGCASPADVGNQAFVPYTADYFFYRQND
jgi:hypothetical protein